MLLSLVLTYFLFSACEAIQTHHHEHSNQIKHPKSTTIPNSHYHYTKALNQPHPDEGRHYEMEEEQFIEEAAYEGEHKKAGFRMPNKKELLQTLKLMSAEEFDNVKKDLIKEGVTGLDEVTRESLYKTATQLSKHDIFKHLAPRMKQDYKILQQQVKQVAD